MQIPNSTYRIQLNKNFTFKQLGPILNYLHELGITTIYASPVTQAIKGSQHGYDVADPRTINGEIGTEEELAGISRVLKGYNMTWLQDIVPNHMAFATDNRWLYDVLERGRVSEFYSFFDLETTATGTASSDRTDRISPGIITCDPDQGARDRRLMVPFLGSTLTECLQKKELSLDLNANGFIIRYFDNEYPVAPHIYRWILTLAAICPPGLLVALNEWEHAMGFPADRWEIFKKHWISQLNAVENQMVFIRRQIHLFQTQVALMSELVQNQHYILTDHLLTNSQINYRRFFTVNSLICLRMEDPVIFSAWHHRILDWYKRGYIQGLRIDHIDGLAEPRRYLEDLKAAFGKDCYTVAEKILEEGESLPASWPIAGTTGYEFLSAASQLLSDPDGSRVLLAFYREHVIGLPAYQDLVFDRKYDFMRRYMQGELHNLLQRLMKLPLLHAGDEDPAALKEALATLMASFPVYRLYPDESPFPEEGRQIIRTAFAIARAKRPECAQELSFLEELFDFSGEDRKKEQKRAFLTRLMQFTGPLAAKGVEDTTFYVYNPYIAHNEVGDTPDLAGILPDEFHTKMIARQAALPHSLNGTTTHDTKRGEDGRIRLNWLTAIPDEWIASVKKWREMNRHLAEDVKGRRAPSHNDEYLIYQALLGGFPTDLLVTDDFRERFSNYFVKALHEAKTETRWDVPDEEYERTCLAFIAVLLNDGSSFLEDFIPFVFTVIRRSAAGSLAQTLLKLTAPGIPDIYQGAESWDTSFVDPDNRRPVDYTERANLLKKINAEKAKGKLALMAFLDIHQVKGAAKLFVISSTLAYRNKHPKVFAEGEYLPVPVAGPFLAYARRYRNDWALVIVPLIRMQASNPETVYITLPADAPITWSHMFTGDIMHTNNNTLVYKTEDRMTGSSFPVALFTGQS